MNATAQTYSHLLSTQFGSISDLYLIMQSACAISVPDYLCTMDSLISLWIRGFIEVFRTWDSDGVAYYSYKATEAGRVAFSRQTL